MCSPQTTLCRNPTREQGIQSIVSRNAEETGHQQLPQSRLYLERKEETISKAAHETCLHESIVIAEIHMFKLGKSTPRFPLSGTLAYNVGKRIKHPYHSRK